MIEAYKIPDINISFNLPGEWQKLAPQPDKKFATELESRTKGHIAKLSFGRIAPDRAPAFNTQDEIVEYSRNRLKADDGGLIKADIAKTDWGTEFAYCIEKYKDTSGMGIEYVGIVFMRNKETVYKLTVQAMEGDITGQRDSAIMSKSLMGGTTSPDEIMKDWSRDPYDQSITGGTLMNKSEDAQYDAQFPDHPLSIVRYLVDSICLYSKQG